MPKTIWFELLFLLFELEQISLPTVINEHNLHYIIYSQAQFELILNLYLKEYN